MGAVETLEVGSCGNPVNIVPNTTTTNIQRWGFSSSYRYEVPCTLTNTGTHIQAKLDMKGTISGGGLDGEYVLSHVDWQWGKIGHRIQGVEYPMEVHLVHYNNKYGSYDDATHASDGVAVLSTLYKLSTNDNSDLAPLIDNLHMVTKAGSNTTVMKGVSANTFLPVIRSPLYRYSGPLPSTSPCITVTWTVFYTTNTVSESQLASIRSVLVTSGGYKTDQVNNISAMVGAAWLDTTTETVRDKREFLQLAVKADTEAETAWYKQPAPVWALLIGMVAVLVVGVVVVLLLAKRIIHSHHLVVASDDIEMD